MDAAASMAKPLVQPGAGTAPPTGWARAGRLPGLDWIRGAAAMWVLFYHVDITLQKAKYFSLPALSLWSSVGYRGVELFFLLSGFVMAKTYASQQSAPSRKEAPAFFVRRLLRIFPAYLVVFLPLFAVAAWKGVGAPPDVPVDGRLFFQNLLLLPRDDLTTFIPVNAWTLTHELMFYVLFMVSFVSWRGFLSLLAAWGVGSVVLSVGGIHLPGWAMQTSFLNAYFLIGLLCALIPWNLPGRWKVPYAAMTLLALVGAIALEGGQAEVGSSHGHVTQVAYALAFALVVFGLSNPAASMPAVLARVAGYLGRISYGIYLVNYPVVVVVALIAKASGLRTFVAPAVLVVAVVLSVLIAELLYRFVETPAVAYGKTLFRKTL